jgi:DNA polymerase-3 subunit delta
MAGRRPHVTRPPVRLLWGEDAYLLREAALEILGDTKATEVDAAGWEGGELQSLATPSLFGEPRALLVNDARSLRKETVEELGRYLQAPDPNATLILCCVVAERGKVPAGLQKLVEPVGEIRKVEIARKELEPWLVARAKDGGLDLAIPGARALVEALGPDPGQLASALQQIQVAFPEQRVGPRQVAQQFRGLGEQKTWDLCDRAFGKDLPGAIRSLRAIEEGGDDPLMVLGGIAARLRDLLKVRSLPDRMPPAEVAKQAGLRFDWQARRYQQQARNFSLGELVELHDRVTEADRSLKSGATGDLVMPVLVTAIAG